MTFADLPDGTAVFLDANVLVYYFNSHSVFDPACQRLVERIESGQIGGLTSAAVLSEPAHRLMTLEAMVLFGGHRRSWNVSRRPQQPWDGYLGFARSSLAFLGWGSAS